MGLLAQFIGSTPQGRGLSEAILNQVAARVRAWGVAVHDLQNFTNEEIQKYLSNDPATGEGPSLSIPGTRCGAGGRRGGGNRSGPPQPDQVGGGERRLRGTARGFQAQGGGPRVPAALSQSGKASGPGPASSPEPDSLPPGSMVLHDEREEQRRQAPHQLDHIQTNIHFDITGVRLRRVEGDHSRVDPLSFPDPESIAKLQRDLEAAKGVNPRLPYVHHARIECWQPRWLGSRLSASAREAFVKLGHRRSDVPRVTRFLARSHGRRDRHLPGRREPHLLPPRVSEDYYPDYAFMCCSCLLARIQLRISLGKELSVGSAISRIDVEVLREVDHRLDSILQRRRAKEEAAAPKARGGKVLKL